VGSAVGTPPRDSRCRTVRVLTSTTPRGLSLLPWSDVTGTKKVRRRLGGDAVVAMVQPVDLWNRDDAAGPPTARSAAEWANPCRG
jgi:hypothetical protein